MSYLDVIALVQGISVILRPFFRSESRKLSLVFMREIKNRKTKPFTIYISRRNSLYTLSDEAQFDFTLLKYKIYLIYTGIPQGTVL